MMLPYEHIFLDHYFANLYIKNAEKTTCFLNWQVQNYFTENGITVKDYDAVGSDVLLLGSGMCWWTIILNLELHWILKNKWVVPLQVEKSTILCG